MSMQLGVWTTAKLTLSLRSQAKGKLVASNGRQRVVRWGNGGLDQPAVPVPVPVLVCAPLLACLLLLFLSTTGLLDWWQWAKL